MIGEHIRWCFNEKFGGTNLEDKIWKNLKDNIDENMLAEGSKYTLRPYHVSILRSMVEKFRIDNKFLCEMAQGTGKTMLLAAVIKLLLGSKAIKKVLVVVDRKLIEDQLFHFFRELLREFNIRLITSCTDNNEAEINISTIQYLLKDNKYEKLFSRDEISLLVFFDINQYLSGKLAEFGSYFNSFRLGISTSTRHIISANIDSFESQKIKDTYRFFGKKVGCPDFEYSLSNAVKDGYLINPIIYSKNYKVDDGLYSITRHIINNIKSSISSIECNSKVISGIDDIEFLLNNLQNRDREVSELVDEIKKSGITKADIRHYGYKKDQLKEFERLLNDNEYFDCFREVKKGAERVWQDFFEMNNWIFGYGLNFIFSTSLKEKKLEQVISGFNFNDYGKRVDALMATKGFISSLIFIEIKCHNTKLIEESSYRPGCWRVSDELSGAVSQIQKTVQKALTTVRTKTDLLSKCGDPTGESIFLYQPKSFIVIGSLSEFTTGLGINEDKFSSFELFRRSITNPEIITFDELFNRAKYIIGTK